MKPHRYRLIKEYLLFLILSEKMYNAMLNYATRINMPATEYIEFD